MVTYRKNEETGKLEVVSETIISRSLEEINVNLEAAQRDVAYWTELKRQAEEKGVN